MYACVCKAKASCVPEVTFVVLIYKIEDFNLQYFKLKKKQMLCLVGTYRLLTYNNA